MPVVLDVELRFDEDRRPTGGGLDKQFMAQCQWVVALRPSRIPAADQRAKAPVQIDTIRAAPGCCSHAARSTSSASGGSVGVLARSSDDHGVRRVQPVERLDLAGHQRVPREPDSPRSARRGRRRASRRSRSPASGRTPAGERLRPTGRRVCTTTATLAGSLGLLSIWPSYGDLGLSKLDASRRSRFF